MTLSIEYLFSNNGVSRRLALVALLGATVFAYAVAPRAAIAADKALKVEIKELDAGIVGRSIDDLDAAFVNTDWALKSGFSAAQRIAQEALADNPYRNFIAVREADKDAPWVKDLVASYQNPIVKAVFDKVYNGTGLAAY